MEFLNLGGNSEESVVAPRSRNKKKVFAVVGITLIAATIGIGTTLASNISLNSNSNVEFGQGVAQTVACESYGDSINVTPLSSFNNSAGEYNDALESYEGQFSLSSIGLDSIDAACQADFFKISVYDSSTSNPLANFVVYYQGGEWTLAHAALPDGAYPTVNAWDVPVVNNDSSSSFHVTPSTDDGRDAVLSNNVYKITVESSNGMPTLSNNQDNLLE